LQNLRDDWRHEKDFERYVPCIDAGWREALDAG